MLTSQDQLTHHRSYGKIYPLKWSYYSNPQMCMFIFTLLLTLSLSILLIHFVFIGIYHKTIGILLCMFITYRFISLGLSTPGLAVQSYDEYLGHEMEINSDLPTNQLIAQESGDTSHRSLDKQENINSKLQPSQAQNHLRNIGFYSFCQQCKVPIRKSTRHCKICRTCVDGFDHHCIWIGKCIGKKNMWQFKQFLCFVFITLIYALILSIQMSKVQRIA